MLKAVIFDFDGTLADTRHLLYACYGRLAEKNGLKNFSPDELEEMKTLSIKDRFKKAGVPLVMLPRLAREARAMYGELIDSAAPFAGIPQLLRTLKNEDFCLCIISSNTADNIHRFLTAHQLDLFDQVYSTSSLFGKHRAINNVTRRLGIGKQEAVYVGDELRDIAACKKVPLKIIAVSWGYDHVSLLQEGEPDYLVHEPREIIKVLREL